MMKFTKKWDVDPINIYNELDQILNQGYVVCLHGDLAAGKTTFVLNYLKHLGFSNLNGSPTFSIINQYANNTTKIYHIDAYRTSNEDYDVEECILDEEATTFLEWPSKVDLILEQIKEDKIINIYFE